MPTRGRGWTPDSARYTLGGMSRSSRLVAAATCVLGLALPVILTGCSSDSTASAAPSTVQQAGPGRVGVAEFVTVIAGPGVQIIDVRTPEEFAEGHIAGAVNIPVQAPDFAARVSRLDPAATYAVYCRSGNRSEPAVAAMKNAGLSTVYELASGTKGWAAAGQPLVR